MAADTLQLWTGPECTVNRIGDRFVDQSALNGHDRRDDDLDLLADIGVAAVRYPLLWERVAPDPDQASDWRWSDRRLLKLRELGIRPIAGLVHHGSGPSRTNLLADDFAPGLADHARAAAERYPWIEDWTPVNEPVTTARFSALYGHWYPHHREERSFWLALLNQIDAVRLSMKAIRDVVPHARLVQTDDLGRTYATAPLRDQAAFDNVRRWMGWDLLCGRVTSAHPLWKRLCGYGFEERLEAIARAPCVPDIIGVNHYLTSDRFLDHRCRRYPAAVLGTNDARTFADVEAVRVLAPHRPGFESVLREAWERYGIPLALTEVHNGCTRDEQMRWLVAAWDAAVGLRAENVDVRAVTAWSLFGSYGWDRLLTGGGSYEVGVFNTRSGIPRPTAMVPLLRGLARGDTARHPVLTGKGWWTRPMRLHHPPVPRAAAIREHGLTPSFFSVSRPPPLLITGATGTLGQALAAACRDRDIAYVLTSRGELDLIDPPSMARSLDRHRPWAVINAAAWVRVDDAEDSPDACFQVNSHGAIALAAACAERDILCVNFSSDLVFDGLIGRAYDEADAPSPINAYGASKALMERQIESLDGAHLIVRAAAFFSPFDPYNFAAHLIAHIDAGEAFPVAGDQRVTPTYVPHLCDAVLDLVIDGSTGIRHLTNGEALSWAEFGERLAEATARDARLIRSVPGKQLGWRAPRPASVPLSSSYGTPLPSLTTAIACFARDLRSRPVGATGNRQPQPA
jgi:dTDP-4-dehydrorhamnose reductase